MMGMKTSINVLVDFLDISGQHNIDHDIFGNFSLKLVKFAFTSLSGRKRGRRFLLAGKLRIALFSDDLPPPPTTPLTFVKLGQSNCGIIAKRTKDPIAMDI